MRPLVTALLAASLLHAPVAAHAEQAGTLYRIGHVTLMDFDQPEQLGLRHWSAFVQALRKLGGIEGQNFVFERRRVTGRSGMQQAVEDLVGKKVALIVVTGGARAAAIQQVPRTVPIVTVAAGDLVGSGIVSAKAIGVTIPQSILLLADRVIE